MQKCYIKCLYLAVLIWLTYLIMDKYVLKNVLAEQIVLDNEYIDQFGKFLCTIVDRIINYFYSGNFKHPADLVHRVLYVPQNDQPVCDTHQY